MLGIFYFNNYGFRNLKIVISIIYFLLVLIWVLKWFEKEERENE